jgi:hypothetical protein
MSNESESKLPTISDDLVVTKYKMAADIVNRKAMITFIIAPSSLGFVDLLPNCSICVSFQVYSRMSSKAAFWELPSGIFAPRLITWSSRKLERPSRRNGKCQEVRFGGFPKALLNEMTF